MGDRSSILQPFGAQFCNRLAQEAGVEQSKVPFRKTEPLLPADNGERFFSAYLNWMKDVKPKQDFNNLCLCASCCVSTVSPATNQPTITNNNPIVNDTTGPSNVLAHARSNQHQTNIIMPPPPASLPTYQQNYNWPWYPMATQPMLWLNSYMVPPQNWNHCCQKYKAYCSRLDRRGRPTHDDRCPFKIKSNITIK